MNIRRGRKKSPLLALAAAFTLLISPGVFGVGADKTPPAIAKTSPLAGATGVDTVTPISATFNEALLPSSLKGNITLKRVSDGAAIAVTPTFSGKILSFGKTTLEPETQYTASVGSGLQDMAKNKFKGYNWTFTTRPRSWRGAKVNENISGAANDPQVSMNPGGNAITVWQQWDGVSTRVYANRYAPSTGWSGKQLVQNGDILWGEYPQASINSSGKVAVIWIEVGSVWVNTLDPKTGWGKATRFASTDKTQSTVPQVAIDAKGNAVTVWQQNTNGQSNIWTNRYSAGSGWGKPALLETSNTGRAYNPQVASDSDGSTIVVWQQDDGSTPNIYANQYAVGKGWAGPRLIEDNAASKDPQIAFGRDGNAVAVWNGQAGGQNGVFANIYSKDSGWGSATMLSKSDPAIGVEFPQIAIGANGTAMAVWSQYGGNADEPFNIYSIYASSWSPDAGWASPEVIDGDNVSTAQFPQVAIDAKGNALAVWRQYISGDNRIRGNRFVAGVGWGKAELLEAQHTGGSDHPQIAMDDKGNGVAVWRQYAPTVGHIWVNLFR